MRRVIIGTAAVRDPEFVREAARLLPGQIAVGIDARDGRVAVEGWARLSDMSADRAGSRFEDAGVAAIVYTDIARDGVLKGLNIEATLAPRQCRLDPGDRLGRPGLASTTSCGCRARCASRRRDHRPRAL